MVNKNMMLLEQNNNNNNKETDKENKFKTMRIVQNNCNILPFSRVSVFFVFVTYDLASKKIMDKMWARKRTIQRGDENENASIVC